MTKFSDLKLDPNVLQAIVGAGYETPTPIQAGAIPPALEGRDVLGIAQTGTGKTASFTLPMITLLGRGRARARMPRSLVLCPTRELAAQVAENFDTYAKHTKLTKALLIGGVSFTEQDRLIDRGVDVLIATPGRLLDHFERGKLLLTGVQIMVVDEADRMLDMGFIPDIERIFQLTPFTRQTLFFSATMAPEIERITNTFLHAPERIEVARQATASETITQRLVEIKPTRRDQAAKQKRSLLRALIDAEGEALTNAIIFCNRKTDVDIVAKSLKKHGYDAAAIHGDLNQNHRTRTLDDFREGKLKLLIASDVAARGLDIPAVSHVFNFDLPSHAEDYVHRIGRTGRAGRKGTSISLATPADDKYLSAIEALVNKAISRVPVPDGFSQEGPAPERPQQQRRERPEAGANNNRRQNEDRAHERNKRREDPPKPRNGDNRNDSRADNRNENRADNRGEMRNDNRNDRHGRRFGRDDNRNAGVLGMGDHVPQFMLVTLRTTSDDFSDDRPIGREQPAVNAQPEAAPIKPKKQSRRRKVRPSEEEAPVEAMETPEAQKAPEPVAEKPQKRTRRKSVKADSPAEAVTDASVAAVEPPPAEQNDKPKRRARKPKAEASDTAEETKPKRTRRKKSDTTDEAASQGDSPKPAPKRRQRKTKDAESEQPVASEPADN